MEHTPLVAAGTVTYGDRSAICTATIDRALECGARSVVLVDNGSEPAAAERLAVYARETPGVRLVRLPRNLGSAEGFRTLLAELGAEQADYAWLLDDDNLAAPDALRLALGTAARKGPRALVACHRTADPLQRAVVDGAAVGDTLQVVGGFLGFDVRRRLRLNAHPHRPHRRRTGAVEVPWAPYGGLLLPSAALGAVDLPRRSFVLYGDDRDWCERLRRAGFTIWLEPTARVDDAVERWGDQAGSDGGGNLGRMVRSTDGRRVYYLIRNSVFAEFRLARGRRRVGAFLVNGAVFSMVAVLTALRLRRLAFLRLFSRAVVAGLRGRWYRTD